MESIWDFFMADSIAKLVAVCLVLFFLGGCAFLVWSHDANTRRAQIGTALLTGACFAAVAILLELAAKRGPYVHPSR